MPGKILTDAERIALGPNAFAARAMAEQFDALKASTTPLTFGLLATTLEPMVALLAENFNAQARQIHALQSRPSMAYRGIWDAGKEYRPGDLVTDRGSLHYCWADVRGQRPGETETWQLCQKRDAR